MVIQVKRSNVGNLLFTGYWRIMEKFIIEMKPMLKPDKVRLINGRLCRVYSSQHTTRIGKKMRQLYRLHSDFGESHGTNPYTR